MVDTATSTTDFRLLIGDSWEPGADGTYDVVNPATEEVVGAAPEASADQAREAARAAAEAFPAWSQTAPEERAALLQAAADRIREQSADLVPLVIAETGCTATVGRQMQVPMTATALRPLRARRARTDGAPARPAGDGGDPARARRAHGRARTSTAGRRRRVHHVLQLPAREHGRQDRPGARGGQHRRRPPRRAGPARGDRAGADPPGRRLPARRRERRGRLVTRQRRGARRVARRRHGELHRELGGRQPHRRGRRAHVQAPAPRARRQGRGARARRRRREDRGRDDRLDVDVPLGSDLHRADPRDRAPLDLRPGRRRARADGRRAEGRRPARGRHRDRPAHHRRAPRPRAGLHRLRQGGGRRDRRGRWPPRPPRSRLLRRADAHLGRRGPA